uniref:Centromere/kinetochore protein zw10 homolog n=1 Tax=Timema genevievae TaxID=629358 RepID=A0A7R9K113_TIMGE|nr:unnamed protein product [Timema genevievae]
MLFAEFKLSKIEVIDLSDNISHLTTSLQSLKYDVKQVMTHNYVKLSEMPEDPANFQSQAVELSREMERLEERIQIQIKSELQNSTGELQTLSVSLQKAALKLQFINQLVTIDTLLKRASEAHTNKQYLDEVGALKSLLELLQQATKTESPEIFRALSLERVYLYERFMYDLMEIWNQRNITGQFVYRWEEMQLDNGCHQTSLKVVVDTDGELERVFQALASMDQLTLNLHKFSTKVLKLLLEPCILQSVSVKCVGNKDTNTVGIDVKTTDNTTLARPELAIVLSNLQMALEFLATHLNIRVDDRGTFLHLVGEVISEELCHCLITDCLGEHVPSSSRELTAFDIVAQQIQGFQTYLVSIGFLRASDKSLVDYAKNVDILCANKECQLLLERARSIMKRDLHDTVKVGLKKPEEELTTLIDKEQDITRTLLSDNTFQFPGCHISKAVQDLVALLVSVLEEVTLSSDMCAVRLFYTARNIVELYAAVVPTFHSKVLDTLPQHVALFHNNCMFLSHRLITLGHEYQGRMPPVLKQHTITFVDLAQRLRVLATETFLRQMRAQRDTLLGILRDCGLVKNTDVEKCIRQCLRQLELLQTVWKQVLPSTVYCKSLGCLVNTMVQELVLRTLSLEDIPADTAVQLVAAFAVVIARAPQVFEDPNEVYHRVHHWSQFLELQLVLGANLRTINDRWTDGKGPLAHVFTPDQTKQLIRALFQNTERRAAVLACIK